MNDYTQYDSFVEARMLANYYKGEILPFVNKCCRKDMTTGDIDGFIFDYKRKVYYALEQKWLNEKNKPSQDIHLDFLYAVMDAAQTNERFCDWKFGVYKIIGNPPFNHCSVIDWKTKNQKAIDRDSLKKFLDLDLFFEDIKCNELEIDFI